MAGGQSTQRRSDLPSASEDWMARKTADLLNLARQLGLRQKSQEQPLASAQGKVQSNRDSFIPVGTAYPNQKRAQPSTSSQDIGAVLAPAIERLNRSQAAKAVGGSIAEKIGQGVGVASGVVHGVQDIADAIKLIGRLIDPIPLAEFQRDQKEAQNDVIDSGKNIFDFARRATSDPKSFLHDMKESGRQWAVERDPHLSPVANSLAGELSRMYSVGTKQGETAFDLGTIAFGGVPRKGLSAIRAIDEATGVAKYLKQGFTPAQAERLAQPYEGMGHHYMPRRTDLPAILGGGKIPKFLSDSPLNVLKPRAIDTGEFYELHFRVDPKFHGTGFGKGIGGGWSGKKLGLKKHGPLGNIWYGAPDALREVVGSVGAGSLHHGDAEGDQSE